MQKSAGCQGCQLAPQGDGRYAVKLRLPNALLDPERHEETHVRFEATFAHGRKAIDVALGAGIALSYRFLRDAKGWRMLVSTDVQGAVRLNHRPGALGLDFNADHLALTEMSGDGNPVRILRIPLVTYGCSTEQAKARIGDAVKQVIEAALAANLGIVIEKLDFMAKKRALKDQGTRYARMLSSLSYNRILELVKARAFDAGIQVQEVNPAYTSILGRQKFAQRYGLSSHGDLCII